jgi:hypothetical protein
MPFTPTTRPLLNFAAYPKRNPGLFWPLTESLEAGIAREAGETVGRLRTHFGAV